ncbi:MAG: chemotaxis protein CheW [Desulfocapsa sp.]|nr:chemotaxis protein CheW [Desulfocapsa sp.]
MKAQSENNPAKNPAAAEYELQDLVRLINDELTEGLRHQSDDSRPGFKKIEMQDIGRHICIELSGNLTAVPLSSVLEAGDLELLQPLPLLPSWLSGITNIRGDIVSVVNLSLFLGLADKASINKRPFLVVHDDTIKVAVIVDRVIGTRSLYLPPKDSSDHQKESSTDAFVAGKAVYKERDGEQEIELFDLKAFLSSPKLRDVTTL